MIFPHSIAKRNLIKSHCSTTTICKHNTFALTAVKHHIVKYCETDIRSTHNVLMFWNFESLYCMIWSKLRIILWFHYTVVDWVWGQQMICWPWRWTVARGRRPSELLPEAEGRGQQFIFRANRSSVARKPRQQLFCYTPFSWIMFNDERTCTRQNDPLHNKKRNTFFSFYL